MRTPAAGIGSTPVAVSVSSSSDRPGAVEVGEVRLREAALQRQRHVERLGEVRDLLLGPLLSEEGLVRPELVEAEAPSRAVGADERRARETERLHAPEEDADVRDVVATRASGDAPHLGGVGERVERASLERAGELEARLVAQVGGRRARAGATWFMYCVVASSSKNSTACAGQPVTSRGELLEHRDGALAPAVADRVGDLGARRRELRHDAVQRPVADEVADVRRDPRRARLDELVVVHLLEALGEHVDLAGDDVDELAQDAVLLGVADAVDGGQQPVELLGV